MKRMNMKVALALSLVLLVATVAFAEHPKALYPGGAVPAGPYSPGIKYGNLVFVSGQISLNSDIAVATQEVMGKILAVLQEANMDFDDVLMTTVYLADMDDFNDFNIEYGKSFGCESTDGINWTCPKKGHPPARATVAVGFGNIPKGAYLEVSMIAGK